MRLKKADYRIDVKNINSDDSNYHLTDLNWKDDGLVDGDCYYGDPSINDYNKGWQMEPYEQRFYANKRLIKKNQ
jgi:hypothetical protein